MDKFIPLSVPNLKGNEKKYVNEAIDSEWVSTAGPFVGRFEKEIAAYLNTDDAVACQSGTAGLHLARDGLGITSECQSGTAGLHLALDGLGITSEHEVLVPALTFIAAVNPVRYIGAEPVFMDCDDSLCMDPDKILEFIKENTEVCSGSLVNKSTGKIIKALIAVHVFGNMCDMTKIMDIAREYNLLVIEDATEALGTRYTAGLFEGMYAGTIGDVGVYSFNGNKIITTGGGGMVVGRDKSLLDKVKYLSTQAKDDEINFVHNEIGYNYRMTNLQAALGVAQLEQLEDFIKIKERNYRRYKEYADRIEGVSLLPFREGIRTNYWFYSLLLNESCKLSKEDMIRKLGEKKIQSRPVWALINEQLPYRNAQCYRIEKAKLYQDRIVNIPCSSNLTEENIQYICKEIEKIIQG